MSGTRVLTPVTGASCRRAARRGGVAGLIGTACAVLLAPAAQAQIQVSRSVLDTGIEFDLPSSERTTVLQRPHPELQPLGVRAGAFLIFPDVMTSAAATSNVFGSTNDAVSDAYAIVAPRVQANSQWSRHSLRGHASGTFRRYLSYPIKNENGYDVGVESRLDIVGSSNVRAAVNADRIYVTQFSGDFPQLSASSLPIDRQVASLRGTYEFNRLTLLGDVNVTRLNFSDTIALNGNTLDQDYLDRRATRLTGRAEYNVSPVTSFFVQGVYTQHSYSDRSTTLDRSGDELRVIAGAAFDVTPLIRTRLGAGYLTRSYDQQGLPSVSGLAFDAQVDYLFSELTTISLAARRDVRDAVVTGSTSYTSSRASAEIDHELLRHLILIARADLEKDDFARIDRDDTLFHVGAGATYTFNRYLVMTPMVDYSNRGSSGAQQGQRFNEIRASVSVAFRL